ncbi:MAG: hypothetical protein ACSHXW_11650 [Yoonia sp.]
MTKETHVSRNTIAPMIVRAGRAFRAVEGKDPEAEGRELAEWLLSGAEIGPSEREMLAELVTGMWRQSKGRPERVGPGHPDARAVVDFYNRCNEKLGPRMTKVAKGQTADKFGISDKTVERYLTEARERSEAIQRAKAAAAK